MLFFTQDLRQVLKASSFVLSVTSFGNLFQLLIERLTNAVLDISDCGSCTSVTVNFSNFSNFSGNEVFFPMLFNQLKNGFLWNSNFWKIIFYAFQILKRKFLCFSPTWKSYFMVFSLHFRVLNLYFLVFFWQHQHHQQRNENYFFTWVT